MKAQNREQRGWRSNTAYLGMSVIQKNVEHIYRLVQEISRQCNRDPPPKILAVSTSEPAESILEAFRHGQQQFGESLIQELINKSNQLVDQAPDIEWHFIGHLERNKCRSLLKVPNLKRISSIDSINIANELESACSEFHNHVEVLVRVESGVEQTTPAVALDEAVPLVGHILKYCPHLHFQGLITLERFTSKTKARECFQGLAMLRNHFVQLHSDKWIIKSDYWPKTDFVLSMGTLSDLDEAVEAGSTEVRLDSAIFGDQTRWS